MPDTPAAQPTNPAVPSPETPAITPNPQGTTPSAPSPEPTAPTMPDTPPPKPLKPSSSRLPLLLTMLLLVLATGVGAYYAGSQGLLSSSTTPMESEPTALPIPTKSMGLAEEPLTFTSLLGFSISYDAKMYELNSTGYDYGDLKRASGVRITSTNGTYKDPHVVIEVLPRDGRTLEEISKQYFNQSSEKQSLTEVMSPPSPATFAGQDAYTYSLLAQSIQTAVEEYVSNEAIHQYVYIAKDGWVYQIYHTDTPETKQIAESIKLFTFDPQLHPYNSGYQSETQNTPATLLADLTYELPDSWEAELADNVLRLMPVQGGGYLHVRQYDYDESVGRRDFYCQITDYCIQETTFETITLGNIQGYRAQGLDNSGGGTEYFGAKGNSLYIISSYGPPAPNNFDAYYQDVLDSLVF